MKLYNNHFIRKTTTFLECNDRIILTCIKCNTDKIISCSSITIKKNIKCNECTDIEYLKKYQIKINDKYKDKNNIWKCIKMLRNNGYKDIKIICINCNTSYEFCKTNFLRDNNVCMTCILTENKI